ncbi:MAG: HAD family phosphatase [Chitinophagaceae bacterium]
MRKYDAFIFDLNGTMIDDMNYHEKAWYEIIVNELKAPLSPEQLKLEMYGKNEELFERVFGQGIFSAEDIQDISMRKEKKYQSDFLPHLKLIDGLEDLLAKAKKEGVGLAIGTAAITFNVDYVLDRLNIRQFFPVIIGAEDVAHSKPDPEVFLKAAEGLGVDPSKCIVFEDAPKGIEAAKRAGMKAVGISSFHTAEELKNDNVLCVVADYSDKELEKIIWG